MATIKDIKPGQKFTTLVEKHSISKSHTFYKELDNLCFLSKNVYNYGNYLIRQDYFKTLKETKTKPLSSLTYKDIQNQIQNYGNIDYYNLPTKVSQQVLMLLVRNWKSHFSTYKDQAINPEKYTGVPRIPNYLHKTEGRFELVYTDQSISVQHLSDYIKREQKLLNKGKINSQLSIYRGEVIMTKNGEPIYLINLSMAGIAITTTKRNIQQVRVVKRTNKYVIEIVYREKIEENRHNLDKANIASIDPGVNILAAITSNKSELVPLLINGRVLKSINHYFNKMLAKFRSYVGNRSSNRILKLCEKRNNRVENYLHQASRLIVNYLIKNNIGTLVIGRNMFWKEKSNMGEVSNQNFTFIPHSRFFQILKYKCQNEGIDVFFTEESYTSKCSFIDNEELCFHNKYLGKRVTRSTFRSSSGIEIHADCNGSQVPTVKTVGL